MSNRLYPVMGSGVIAALLSCAIFGALTFTAFNIWRKASVLQDTYAASKKAGVESLDRFFLKGEPSAQIQGMFKPLTAPEDVSAYTKVKGSEKELDAFFKTTVLPQTWLAWACIALIVVSWIALTKVLKGVFLDFTGRMVLTFGLMGLLGGYFWFLAGNQIYPLGIDLAGGTELVYRLEYRDILKRIQDTRDRIAKLEANKGKPDEQTKAIIDDEMILRFRSNLRALEESMSSAPEKATEVVRKRVDPTGTKGVPITRFGEDRIRIQLPKASPEDVERIKRAISTQGRLTFHALSESAEISEKVRKSPTKEWGDYALKEIFESDPYDPDGRKQKKDEVVINRTPEMEGSGITSAYSSRSEQGGYKIQIHFDAAASARFEEVTKRNLHKKLAIVLDGTCYLAPTIQSVISDQCQITGSFTQQQAAEISGVLTAGSLPAEVVIESEFVVGPSLGHEQIESGMLATLIASTLVAVSMWLYYRTCGFVTLLCLTVNLVVLMGGLGFFKATMTLPGIAGIALTLGMAVDANVLIFERMREEQARGRPLRQVVHLGFDRAATAIIDSNITTLISGVILYYLGTGPVRGFAVTLSLGVMITLFANLWVCRLIIEWLVAREAVTAFPMRQFFGETKYDFMGKRKPWMYASGLLVAASAAGFIYMGVLKNDIYDVDFTGGCLVQFNFARNSEKTDREAKEAVKAKLEPAFKANIEKTVAKLKEFAAGAKSGEALLKDIHAALPDLAQTSLGRPADLTPQSLNNVIEPLQKVLDDMNRGKLDLIVQSFGEPVGTSNAERTYKSFTLTTRINDSAAAIDILDEELMRTFAGTVKPQAVEIKGDAIRVRLESPLPNATLPSKELLAGIYEAEFSKLGTQAHLANFKTHLQALKVSDIKEEPFASGAPGGQPYIELTPLPADVELRKELRMIVEEAQLKQGTTDYRSEGPISRKSVFGKQVSGEAFLNSVFAVLASLLGIFVYMWLRFEFTGAWGYGAIVALIHDSTIAIGGLVLVNALDIMPALVDLNVLAAVLTIIGYSVNDTIVIFDRIREVKTAHPTRSLTEIVNESVNGMLSRTVLTSGLTLLSVLALLVFGGQTIRGLAFTLFVGMVAGVYSTVFIASPLMIWWTNRYGASRAKAPEKPKEEKSDDDAARAVGAQI